MIWEHGDATSAGAPYTSCGRCHSASKDDFWRTGMRPRHQFLDGIGRMGVLQMLRCCWGFVVPEVQLDVAAMQPSEMDSVWTSRHTKRQS